MPAANVAEDDNRDLELREQLGRGAKTTIGSQILHDRRADTPVYLPGDPRLQPTLRLVG